MLYPMIMYLSSPLDKAWVKSEEEEEGAGGQAQPRAGPVWNGRPEIQASETSTPHSAKRTCGTMVNKHSTGPR